MTRHVQQPMTLKPWLGRKHAPRARVVRQGDHAHHYRIAEPNGPLSEAVCLTCGATRQFSNSGDDVAWSAWQ